MNTRNDTSISIYRDVQFYKFCLYGFLKNLKFFDPFLILFFREMGLSFFQIGTLYAVREIVINLTEIPTGFIADRFGRKKALLSAFSFYIVSFIIFYIWGSRYTLSLLAMIFFGLGETLRSGSHKAMILEYLKVKGLSNVKLDYYGRTRSCSQLGSALSSLIAAGLVFYTGSFKIIFLASTIPYILDFFLILSYPSYLDKTAGTDQPKDQKVKKSLVGDIKELMDNKNLRKILINTSVVNAAFKIGKDYLQPIVKNWVVIIPVLTWLGKEQKVSVALGIIYFLIYLVSSYFSGNSSKYVRKFKTSESALNFFYLITSVLFLMVGIVQHLTIPAIAIVLFFGYYIIQNLQKPAMVSVVSDYSSHQLMATVLSLQNELRALMAAILAPLLGYLIDHYGIANGFLVLSVIFLMGFPFVKLAGDGNVPSAKKNEGN